MASDKHRTIRGKMIRQDNLLLDVREDGSLHVKVHHPGEPGQEASSETLTLPEADAILLNELLDDMIEWHGGADVPEVP